MSDDVKVIQDADDPNIMLVYAPVPAEHIVLDLVLKEDGTVAKPTIKQPKSKARARPKTVPLHVRAVGMIEQLYHRHAAGCCLHIVTDDGNIQDKHVDHCVEYAEKMGHRQCHELARLLQSMSVEERAQALGMPWCPQCKDGKERWQKDCCGHCHECGHELVQPKQELM